MSKTHINPVIFREYDIRGVAERDLDDDLVTNLGRAIGTFLRRKGASRIALGRDCRLSSERLHAALSDGLLQTGADLVDIGVVPTPLMYFSVFHYKLDGGVQITGSHNPPEDNGFKIMCGTRSLFGDQIRELRTMIETRDFRLPGRGIHEELDPLPAYTGFMRGNIALNQRRVRFAVDAGNGAAGPTALAAMRVLGLRGDPLYCEMDGRFPHHHPDPSVPDNLQDLIERVRAGQLDVGIAYDGDGDRLGVVDDQGNIIWGDRLMVVFARHILNRHPGATILGEVKCSQTMYDDIARHGGRPIVWKTGHSLIKKKMREERALLAGEMSGHLFFSDKYYGFDDAIYASLRLLEILDSTGKRVSELLADLPTTYSTPEIRVEWSDDTKFDVVAKVLERFRRTHDVIDVDGARIDFKDGWGLVRASNTQPALVLRFEAQSESRLGQIRGQVEDALREIGSQ